MNVIHQTDISTITVIQSCLSRVIYCQSWQCFRPDPSRAPVLFRVSRSESRPRPEASCSYYDPLRTHRSSPVSLYIEHASILVNTHTNISLESAPSHPANKVSRSFRTPQNRATQASWLLSSLNRVKVKSLWGRHASLCGEIFCEETWQSVTRTLMIYDFVISSDVMCFIITLAHTGRW